MNKYWTLGIIFLLTMVTACGKSDKSNEVSKTINVVEQKKEVVQEAVSNVSQSEVKSVENSFQPFYIYSDKGSNQNHYTPSGYMPNGNCLSLEEGWSQNCRSGSSCIKIVYDVKCSQMDQKWGGMYWLNPPNNWGRRKGGFNLTGAQKLTFWAKGDVGGEQIQEFTIGGIDGDFPDSDKTVIGPVILSNEWKQYSIDLRGKDLSYISGGFAWSTEVGVNPETCTFYLDDIKFE